MGNGVSKILQKEDGVKFSIKIGSGGEGVGGGGGWGGERGRGMSNQKGGIL